MNIYTDICNKGTKYCLFTGISKYWYFETMRNNVNGLKVHLFCSKSLLIFLLGTQQLISIIMSYPDEFRYGINRLAA